MSFSARDQYITLLPFLGPRAGQPLRLKTVVKVSFDPGGKTTYAKGLEQTPAYIIRGSAEPKLQIDLSSAAEAWEAVKWLNGIGGSTFLAQNVFQKPGFASKAWAWLSCELMNGGGFDADDGAGVQGKLEIALINATLDGVSIYTPRYAT